IAFESFAEESGRSDADYGHGMPLHDECGNDDGRNEEIGGLPDTVAEHGDRWSGGLVVLRRKHSAAEGANPEGSEIGAADILRTERTGNGFHTLAANAHAPTPSLKGGNLFEFRSFGLKAFVQREGNHAPTVLGTTFDAALVAFADAIEPAGVRNRQGTEHYGVNQGENRGCAAD